MTIWCCCRSFFPYPNKWHFSWHSTKARIISNKPYFRYWWCLWYDLANEYRQPAARTKTIFIHTLHSRYCRSIWFTLIIKHTQRQRLNGNGKNEKDNLQFSWNSSTWQLCTCSQPCHFNRRYRLFLLFLLLRLSCYCFFDGLIPSSRIFSLILLLSISFRFKPLAGFLFRFIFSAWKLFFLDITL